MSSGPAAWPLIGHAPSLIRGGMGWVEEQERQHGTLIPLDVGPQSTVLLCHPDHAQHVLRDNAANYAKQGTFWSSVRSLIGLGLPTSEGELWRNRRRMMNPQFRAARIAELGNEMADVIAQELADWPTDGDVVRVGHLVNRVTMAVIVRTMFGTGMTDEQSATVSEAMTFSLDHMVQKVFTDALPSWVPVPGRKAHRQAVERIDAVIYELLEQRRQSGAGNDLLSMMLMMRDDDGNGLSDTDLRDETMSIFVAGYETTAVAVAWTIDRMARDPHFAQRLADEATSVLEDRPARPSDVPNLDLAGRVFKETLRMQGPIWFLAREAQEDDEIDGHPIPAGTLVSLMLNRIHRSPDVWENPDTFDPDRFLPERSQGRHPCAFVPFGAGQRKCIGEGFAMLEGTMLIASIARNFRFEAGPDGPSQVQYAITMRPRDGMPLRVFER